MAYPVPCAYVADIMERNVIANQKAHPAAFPDARYLVPLDKLDQPLKKRQQRSEADTRQVFPAILFVAVLSIEG